MVSTWWAAWRGWAATPAAVPHGRHGRHGRLGRHGHGRGRPWQVFDVSVNFLAVCHVSFLPCVPPLPVPGPGTCTQRASARRMAGAAPPKIMPTPPGAKPTPQSTRVNRTFVCGLGND